METLMEGPWVLRRRHQKHDNNSPETTGETNKNYHDKSGTVSIDSNGHKKPESMKIRKATGETNDQPELTTITMTRRSRQGMNGLPQWE
jgi:hypothetical protein